MSLIHKSHNQTLTSLFLATKWLFWLCFLPCRFGNNSPTHNWWTIFRFFLFFFSYFSEFTFGHFLFFSFFDQRRNFFHIFWLLWDLFGLWIVFELEWDLFGFLWLGCFINWWVIGFFDWFGFYWQFVVFRRIIFLWDRFSNWVWGNNIFLFYWLFNLITRRPEYIFRFRLLLCLGYLRFMLLPLLIIFLILLIISPF